MQAYNCCAATVSRNFTMYRNGESIWDSPEKAVPNTPINSFFKKFFYFITKRTHVFKNLAQMFWVRHYKVAFKRR